MPMKKISNYFQDKISVQKKIIYDDKTIFFIFSKIIREEYGRRGLCEFTPHLYRYNLIYIHAKRSSWAHELFTNKDNIIKKINKELKSEEIRGLKIDTKP